MVENKPESTERLDATTEQPSSIRTVTQQMTIPPVEEENELLLHDASTGQTLAQFIKGETFLVKGVQFRIERIDQRPDNTVAMLVVPCGSGSRRQQKQRKKEQKEANRRKVLRSKHRSKRR